MHFLHRIFRLRRISSRLLFWMIVMIIFFNSLHLVVFVFLDKKERLAEVEQALRYALQNQVEILDNWANERMNEVIFLANLPITKQLQLDEMTSVFHYFAQSNSEIASLVFVDRFGNVQIDTAVKELPPSKRSLRDREYFRRAEQHLEQWMDHVISRASGAPVLIFSAPVTSYHADFQGVVFAAVRLSKINELLRHSIYGDSGQVFVLNEQGVVLSHLSREKNFTDQRKFTHIHTNFDHARGSFTSYKNQMGEEVFGSYTSIFSDRFIIVNEILMKEILIPHQKIVLVKIGITLLFIFAGIVFVVVFTRFLLEPLRLLIQNIQKIKEGTYQLQIQEDRCSLAPLEFQELIKTFKEMTVTIDRQHEVLKHQSRIDDLTGIYNRRFFDECFTHEWQHAKQNHQPLSLLMIDIDYFKVYNDTFGHHEGDQCLREIANVMKKVLRNPGDVLSRYGGEEFAVLLPNTELETARNLAETIRAQVEHLQIPHGGHFDVVTVSIGAACLIPTDTKPKETLLTMADDALYKAKSSGRNQVYVSDG